MREIICDGKCFLLETCNPALCCSLHKSLWGQHRYAMVNASQQEGPGFDSWLGYSPAYSCSGYHVALLSLRLQTKSTLRIWQIVIISQQLKKQGRVKMWRVVRVYFQIYLFVNLLANVREQLRCRQSTISTAFLT